MNDKDICIPGRERKKEKRKYVKATPVTLLYVLFCISIGFANHVTNNFISDEMSVAIDRMDRIIFRIFRYFFHHSIILREFSIRF